MQFIAAFVFNLLLSDKSIRRTASSRRSQKEIVLCKYCVSSENKIVNICELGSCDFER